MPQLLKKMKISSTYPKTPIYSDKKFLGSRFFHLKSLHISAWTTYLIKHLQHNSHIGKTAQAMLNWAQHAAVIFRSLLSTPLDLPYLEGRWINQLRQDLKSINATIYIHDTWTYPTTRQHNLHIMECFIKQSLSTPVLQKRNYCYLYLQVTHLSDITTSDGKRIIASALNNPYMF